MELKKPGSHWMKLMVISLIVAVTVLGCDTSVSGTDSDADTAAPAVSSTIPADEASGVAIDADISASFSEDMDDATIDTNSFTLFAGTTQVSGTVAYDESTATASFHPASHLAADSTYTATITTGATDAAGNALEQNNSWTFATVTAENLGTSPSGGAGAVDLGTAANYALLAKAGVSTTGTTMVTGDIGLSPASRTELTGFSETMDVSNEWSTSDYVTGKLYAADYTDPTPTVLTAAISDMETAYAAAAGFSDPDVSNLGAGEIGGLTLEPGLYKWGTGVSITTDVTLWGSDTSTWVFQIAEELVVANGAKVTLAGGALAENIVWQVGSHASLGTTAEFAGTLLTATNISVSTGATINGRLLAQTAITLDANAVTAP